MSQVPDGSGSDPARPGSPDDVAGHGGASAYAGLHSDAVRLLSRWTAPSDGQERVRLGMLEHLRLHPDAMARSGPPQHFTASCLVMDATGSQVLLTLHRKARAWFQFGGHYEPQDRSVHAAAAREAREESGIPDLVLRPGLVALDRHRLGIRFRPCREHLDLRFLAVADEATLGTASEESLDVRWWPADDLPAGTREELTPLVAACRAALLDSPQASVVLP